MLRMSLAEGRHAFGNDPSRYAAARPDYPDELYTRLAQRAASLRHHSTPRSLSDVLASRDARTQEAQPDTQRAR
jgi:uncharacterized protein YeaO (DUF488 family)